MVGKEKCFYNFSQPPIEEIEHSCMGEFRDMGNPAQAAKPRVQDFFYHACRIYHVPIFAHTGKIFLYESLHNKHFFGLFLISSVFFCQTAANSV
jgi:hypothetical protein